MSITHLAAFFGGVISLFTPCSVMVIPMFAATMTNRKRSSLHTLAIFSSGLVMSLIPLALGAVLFNQLFNLYRQPISIIIGLVLFASGLYIFLGHQFNIPDLSPRIQTSKNITRFGSIFTLGVIAGLGSTACVGPILGAILSLSAAAHGTINSLTLMLSYALGLLIPLIFITLLYETLFETKISQVKKISVVILGRSFHLFDLLGGGLLILIGIMFIFQQGSIATIPFISRSSFLDASFDLQDKLFLLQ